jgi:uncharacterized membrane protein YgcG
VAVLLPALLAGALLVAPPTEAAPTEEAWTETTPTEGRSLEAPPTDGGGSLTGTLPAAPPQAAQRQITLQRFDAVYQVRRDGSMLVTETLDLRFEGSWNGFERDVLHRHRSPDGRRERVRVAMQSITDGDGEELRVEESGIRDGRRYRIWVPGAENATRRVILRYRVDGALRFFAEDAPEGYHDELFWEVTGTDWEMAIEEVRARVGLPDGVDGVRAWGYTGREGSMEQAVEVRTAEAEAEIRALRRLAEGEGLAISVTWDPGVIERPGALARSAGRVLSTWPATLPLAALIGMLLTWKRRGKDPPRRAVMVQYEPPEDLSPAEVGTLVDHKAEMHDVTATLVDLAVRGYLRIEEERQKGFLGLGSSIEYTFHQRRPRSEWTGLRPHERRYLEGLFPPRKGKENGTPFASLGEAVSYLRSSFGAWREARSRGESFDAEGYLRDWTREREAARNDGGTEEDDEPLSTVKLSDLENRFYKHLEPIRKKIYARLKQKGIYEERPDRVKGKWAGWGVLVMIAGFFLTIFTLDPPVAVAGFAPHPFALAVGVMGSGLVILAFSPFMGVRTEEGVRMLEWSLGFKEFLARVEAPQYARMITSPELFEKYLPYAMAFQVEDRWSRAFDDLYRQPPEWYGGAATGGAFRASRFSRQLRSMSTQASRTSSSSPGGSSGSGGGGSVGGGSGGGGGRGF